MARIKIRLQKGYSILYKIKSFSLFKIDFVDGKKIYNFPFLNKNHICKKPIFYLKINKKEGYTYINLQQWINIINELNADFYIICDDIKLENRILRNVIFKDSNIKFIKSEKNSQTKKIVKNIASDCWKNATFAHLTAFWHARENNIEEFWNIDADDTALCAEPNKCAQIITQVQDYSKKENIDAFSLDMWKSKTLGKHWSFGVTFVRCTKDYFKYFSEIKDFSWNKKYLNYDNNWNLDWFFNYLGDSKKIKTGNFYVENLMFFHCGDMVYNIMGSGVSVWHDGILEFPIVKEIYPDSEFSKVAVSKECVKFDIGLKTEKCKDYAYKKLVCIHYFSKELKNLLNISDSK